MSNIDDQALPANELEKFLTQHKPEPFRPHVWARPQEGIVEVALEDVACYHEWLKGEGADISIWRACGDNRVVGATLPYRDPARMDRPLELVDDAKLRTLQSVLRQIITDLPAKRDWLDPHLEQLARELSKEKRASANAGA